MDLKLDLVLVVGVVVATIGNSEAQIYCHMCDSIVHSNCGYPFFADNLPECFGNQCVSSTGSLTDESFVERGCTEMGSETFSDGCIEASHDGYNSTDCYCSLDYCNAGETTDDGVMIKPTNYTILFVVALASLLAIT